MQAIDKNQAIDELVNLLHQNETLKDPSSALKAVMQREAIRSTGVGQGFAIPHAKSGAVDRLIMAVGKPPKPIDFDSIDGQPVSIIFLLLSPVDQTGPHIQAIARISRLMTDQKLRDKLWNCSSPQEFYQLITDHVQQNLG